LFHAILRAEGVTLLRLADKSLPCIISVFGLVMANAVFAASTTLKAYRFGNIYYVSISDVAYYYGLGRDARGVINRAEYKTSSAQLEMETDRRDIFVSGVNHWLSTPILATRNKLWISEVDVMKTLDPVLRPEHLRKPGRSVRTIVLDPGHGGGDRGTRGRSSFEKEMTLDLAKRLERYLTSGGVRVLMTRTVDKTVGLDDRVAFAKTKGADLFVSLHFNSGGSAEGIETYCTPPAGATSTADPHHGDGGDRGDHDAVPNNRFDDQNVWLAHCTQKAVLGATRAVDRGVRRARFYVLRYATCPAILIEAGFLSNPAEEHRILQGDYREMLAKGIADGILTYKKTLETPPAPVGASDRIK
jgi:N-acetylmuramoyl-L-alanine amidase